MTATTHTIDTFADFERLIAYTAKVPSEYVVVDVETNSEQESVSGRSRRR